MLDRLTDRVHYLYKSKGKASLQFKMVWTFDHSEDRLFLLLNVLWQQFIQPFVFFLTLV